MFPSSGSFADGNDAVNRAPSLMVSTTPEKPKENEENGFGSPMSPFLHSTHSQASCASRVSRSTSRSSFSHHRMPQVSLHDLPTANNWIQDYGDDNDSDIPLTSFSNASRTADAIPPRSATRTTDSLLSPSYGYDDAPQLSARSEPNFRLHALCPSSPDTMDSALDTSFDIITDASTALGYDQETAAETDDDYANPKDAFYHLNTSGNSFNLHHSQSTLGSSSSLFASGGTGTQTGASQQISSFTLGSPTPSFSRISPRTSGASSRIKWGGNMNLSNSSFELGGLSSSTVGSGYGSSPSYGTSGASSSRSSLSGISPVAIQARNRERDGHGSPTPSASAVSPGIRSLNTSAANISIAYPRQPLFSSAGSRLSSRSIGSDSQLAGISSSSILSTSVSSSEGYISAATNDSSARSSIDIQYDPDEMMNIDLGRPVSPQYQHGARTLPANLDSGLYRSSSRQSLDAGRDSPSPALSFQLPSLTSPNSLATPSSGRSRSRTFGSSERPSPSAASPSSPLPTFSLGSPTLAPRSSHSGALPEKSPTRPRGGGAGAAFAARTQSFLSNPHPSMRHRRDSSSSSLSRPRPKPTGLQHSGSDIELPKSKTGVHGLIPNLNSRNVVPASPSRPQARLPYFNERNNVACNRITPETFIALLNGEFHGRVTEFYIIDCRSEEEYLGGHILGAMHSPDPSVAIQHFITDRLEELVANQTSVALIFHCEFSQRRGPATISAFRDADRGYNAWPNLYYHDVYCLDGGYSKFYANHPNLCDPCGYVREPIRDHKSGPAAIRKAQSVSRITFSQSTPALPTHHIPEPTEDDTLPGAEEAVTTRPRSATEDLIEFSDSNAPGAFSSSEQFADDENYEA